MGEENGHGDCSVNVEVGQVVQSTAVVENNGGTGIVNVECVENPVVDIVRDTQEEPEAALCNNAFAILQNVDEQGEDINTVENEEAAVEGPANDKASGMESQEKISVAQKEVLKEIELVKNRLATPLLIPRLPGLVGLPGNNASLPRRKVGSNKNVGSSTDPIGIGKRTR